MKSKILIRLILYFFISLIIFSIMLSLVFGIMLNRYSSDLHLNELQSRAVRISKTMSEFLTGQVQMHSQAGNKGTGLGGYGAYLKLIDDIAMSDVWLIDKEKNIITRGHGNEYVQQNLPKEADEIIEDVLFGKSLSSRSFDELIGTAVLTVGEPITTENGEILGAVLLHSPIFVSENAVKQQLQIFLISIGLALPISLVVSALLSVHFTRPLNQMKQNALLLAEGNYTAKNGYHQTDEIGALADSLDILSDKLYQNECEKAIAEQKEKDFLSAVSHELRTPVTVIRGSLEALSDGVVDKPEMVKEYCKQMLSESIQLQRMINDLLELSRLQNTSFQINKNTVNIIDILNDAVRSMNITASEHNISIISQYEHTGIAFYGDYIRLKQMFITVIDNAIKFSDRNYDVTIIEKSSKKSIRVEVINKGETLTNEQTSHIFEKFYRGTATYKGGTGLGLSIAKEIADKHNIRVSASSLQGITSLYFDFPDIIED